MTAELLLFLLGLGLLYLGAEWLVLGSGRLARSVGISALAVGLTVVAFGTSTPELVVSVLASARGQADVAVGNVVGSNIVNIALILGLSALIHPLRVQARLVRREIPIVIAASVFLLLLAADGTLGRLDGALLLLGFAGYLVFVVRASRGEGPAEAAAAAAAVGVEEEVARAPGRLPNGVLIAAGLLALVAGAYLLVETSVAFARRLGVPELVIALTLVAAGTSLPELATSAVASLRRRADIAIGNVVGSNIFNILAILGISAVLRPLRAAPPILAFDGPVMLGAAALLLPLAWSRFRLERWEGFLLLMGYVAYIALLLR